MTPKLQLLIGQYVAALLMLFTGAVTPMLVGASTAGEIFTQKHAIGLVLAFIIWVGGCAAHYLTTGDPAPVTPAVVNPMQQAQLDRMSAQIEAILAYSAVPAPPVLPTQPPALPPT